MKPRRLLLALGIALPLNAFAQIPDTDWAGLAQAILSNYQKLAAAAEKVSMMGAEVSHEGVMAEQRVDAWNTAAANAIIRMNQQRTDVHNKDVAQDARPLMDACSAFSTSFEIEEALCQYMESMARQAEKTDQKTLENSPSLASTLTGKTPTGPAGAGGAAGAAGAGSKDKPSFAGLIEDLGPENISPLVGIPVQVAKNEVADFQRMLDIAFPAYQGNPQRISTSDVPGLFEAREAIRTNLARKVAGSIAARRQADQGPSEAGMVSAFGEKWYSPERLETLAAGKTITEESLWRDRAVSRAFMVWRAVNDYEIALEREVILATQLLEAVEKQ